MAAGDRTIDPSTKTNLFLIVYGFLCLAYTLYYIFVLSANDTPPGSTARVLQSAAAVKGVTLPNPKGA